MAKQGHLFVTVNGVQAVLSDQNPEFVSKDAPFPNAVQSWGPEGRQKDRPLNAIGPYETAQRDGAIAVFGPYDHQGTQRTITVLPE